MRSATGRDEAMAICSAMSDLLVLGHSVPQSEKRDIVARYHQFNDSPVLSLLRPGQTKLPEVEYGIEYLNPEALLKTVTSILGVPKIDRSQFFF